MQRDQRTLKQNNSLHLWLEQVAETLNDNGFDMKKTLKPEIDIPWTKTSAKEFLYKPILEAMTNKDSTTDMDTLEPSIICDVLSKHIGEKFGVVLPPFPNRFNQ